MFIIILLLFTNSLSAQYFPFIKDNKLGYINIKGEVKIDAKLDTKAEYFLSKKGRNGYLLGLNFPDNCYFKDNYAVFLKEKWFWILFPYKTEIGLIDTNSNVMIFDGVKKLYTLKNNRIRYDYNDSKMPNGYDHNIGIINLDKILDNYKFRDILVAEASKFNNELLYSKNIYVGDLIDDRILIYEYFNKLETFENLNNFFKKEKISWKLRESIAAFSKNFSGKQ